MRPSKKKKRKKIFVSLPTTPTNYLSPSYPCNVFYLPTTPDPMVQQSPDFAAWGIREIFYIFGVVGRKGESISDRGGIGVSREIFAWKKKSNPYID